MAKTVTFQVRVTPEDYRRLQAVAGEEFLGVATWARRAVLRALAAAEAHRSESADVPDDSTRAGGVSRRARRARDL
jgi:hypothetical protein